MTKPWRELQKIKSPENEPVIIGMNHFLPMLIFLVIGISLTLLSFGAETSLSWCHQSINYVKTRQDSQISLVKEFVLFD